MKDFELIKRLIGNTVTEDDLKCVDCYVTSKMGVFIPSTGICKYANKPFHTHPSYMITIALSTDDLEVELPSESKNNSYLACIVSPEVPHEDKLGINYYCILIEKEYFEEQYRLYSGEDIFFDFKGFTLCKDILMAINMFVFEYSKQMRNCNITLDAQGTIITHWIIRSILGENANMKSISSNYNIARVQHYIHQHYSEHIVVDDLAKLVNMSPSNFNRLFKQETELSPIEYLIYIRIERAKQMLKRKEFSITEIATACGFSSSAHFASSFRKITGVTPSEFRKAYL